MVAVGYLREKDYTQRILQTRKPNIVQWGARENIWIKYSCRPRLIPRQRERAGLAWCFEVCAHAHNRVEDVGTYQSVAEHALLRGGRRTNRLRVRRLLAPENLVCATHQCAPQDHAA
jgi:hypothetical protein